MQGILLLRQNCKLNVKLEECRGLYYYGRVVNEMEQIKKRIAKPDVLLIALLLLIGFASLLIVRVRMNQNGTAIRITADGAVYGTYSLEEDQMIPIEVNGNVTNTLRISDGKAKMVEADCPDKLCMHQKAVSKQGETIVCLPNKIVVEAYGEEESEFDSISR